MFDENSQDNKDPQNNQDFGVGPVGKPQEETAAPKPEETSESINLGGSVDPTPLPEVKAEEPAVEAEPAPTPPAEPVVAPEAKPEPTPPAEPVVVSETKSEPTSIPVVEPTPAPMPVKPKTELPKQESLVNKAKNKVKEEVKGEVKGKTKEEIKTALKDKLMKNEAVRNKKLLYGCLSSFGCGTILLLVLIFIFIGQSPEQTANFAKFLNIDQGSLINTLILIVNFFFGLSAITAFILTIVGLFKTFAAKKTDTLAKKRGVVLAVASFVTLVLVIILWFTAWTYLNSRKIDQPTSPIGLITEPAVTTNLTAPIDITFDASSLPFNPNKYEIISYSWDFGDGTQGAGSSVETHRYETKGDGRYDMSLSVTFRDLKTGVESQDKLTHIITIAEEQVMAAFTVDSDEGAAPLTVLFDASDSKDPDGAIETYEWDFEGKGFVEGEVTEEHVYAQIGTYTARLRVVNAEAEFNISEQEIIVSSSLNPIAIIEVNPSADGNFYAGNSYSFEGSKSTSPSGNVTSYEWDFGDGTSKISTRTAPHSFSKEGIYEVILKIKDEDGLEGETSEKIEVVIQPSAPQPVINTVPAVENDSDTFIEGPVPFEVTFDAKSSTDPDDDIVDYQWDFDGDGAYDSAGETVSYVFEEQGNYIVSLTATDAASNEGKTTFVVQAVSAGLLPAVTATPTSGIVPLIVEFDATQSVYSDGDIVSYEWNFGDGTASRQDVGEVTYKYTKIGTFEASVTVKTSDGKQEDISVIITVRPVALEACFEPSKLIGDAPLNINFNPQCSTGTITKYKWEFGDGEVSTEHRPNHTYEQPGSYEVVLEVTDPQNVIDTTSEFITVSGQLTTQ